MYVGNTLANGQRWIEAVSTAGSRVRVQFFAGGKPRCKSGITLYSIPVMKAEVIPWIGALGLAAASLT
jgi:hypothetical protein